MEISYYIFRGAVILGVGQFTAGAGMNPEWFAARLRELRGGAGLTQQQLADKAGLTREGVAQVETGRSEPAWRTVVALCDALGVSCDAFLREPGEQPAKPR